MVEEKQLLDRIREVIAIEPSDQERSFGQLVEEIRDEFDARCSDDTQIPPGWGEKRADVVSLLLNTLVEILGGEA